MEIMIIVCLILSILSPMTFGCFKVWEAPKEYFYGISILYAIYVPSFSFIINYLENLKK